MDSKSTKRGKRGRPPTDLAANIRNRLWAEEVYRRASCSWDELDFRFIPTTSGEDAPRPRAFWSMAHAGIDPRSKPRLQSGLDLVEAVEAAEGFSGTKALYESKLWKLIEKAPSRTERGQIFKTLMQSLDMFQADWLVRWMGHWILPDEPAFRSRDDDATKHVIRCLIDIPSLDGIALLGCAYVDAIDRLDLIEANAYLKGIRLLFQAFTKLFPEHAQTWIRDLRVLVEKRVCRNDWSDLYASSARVKSRAKKSALPEADAESKAMALLNGDLFYRGTEYFVPTAPIVPMNDRLLWFHAHRRAIREGYEAAGQPLFIDTLSVDTVSIDRETADELAQKLQLPMPPKK